MPQNALTLKEQVINYIRGHGFVTLKELYSHFKKGDLDLYLKHIVDVLAELTRENLIDTRVDSQDQMESIIAPKGFMPNPDC